MLDVIIDKCENPNAWYKDHVGEKFICVCRMKDSAVALYDDLMKWECGFLMPVRLIPFKDCTILNITGFPPYKDPQTTISGQPFKKNNYDTRN